jgi:hypothetical protein
MYLYIVSYVALPENIFNFSFVNVSKLKTPSNTAKCMLKKIVYIKRHVSALMDDYEVLYKDINIYSYNKTNKMH